MEMLGPYELGRVHHADCREALALLPAESVQCCVCSPPYWGLRRYDVPDLVWDAGPAWPGGPPCDHLFGEDMPPSHPGPGNTRESALRSCGLTNPTYHADKPNTPKSAGAFCRICGAWRGQLGLEPTPDLFVKHLVAIFREVRRVLRDDGVLFLNIGDCYATGAGSVGECPGGGVQGARWAGDVDRLRDAKRGYRGDRLANGRGDQPGELRRKTRATRDGTHAGKHLAMAAVGPMTQPNRMPLPGLKPKDLVGIPWLLAFALRADGWFLRAEIIWHKTAPMPESVRDRPTRAHEQVFLLSKSGTYFYNEKEAKEPAGINFPANHRRTILDNGPRSVPPGTTEHHGLRSSCVGATERNWRTVWTIGPEPNNAQHYAPFPRELARRCIVAGSKVGDVVLDPFAGTGTTVCVADGLGRRALGFDLGEKYVEQANERSGEVRPADARSGQQVGLLTEVR